MEAWGTNLHMRPMVKFATKLKILKKKLRLWNKVEFGNIHQAVKNVEDHILTMELLYDQVPSDNKRQLAQAHQELHMRLETDENFWRRKTNIRWIKEGDKNTRFFHHSVKMRRQVASA